MCSLNETGTLQTVSCITMNRSCWNWNTSYCQLHYNWYVSLKLKHFMLSAALQLTGFTKTGTLHNVSSITVDMFHWNWNTSYCQLHYNWYVSLKVIVEVVQSWIGILYIISVDIISMDLSTLGSVYPWIYLPLDPSTYGSSVHFRSIKLWIHQHGSI